MTEPREVRRLDELPRDVHPTRDLWPAIAASIEPHARVAHPMRSVRALPRWLPWALCAGLVLAVIGGAWLLPRGGDARPDAALQLLARDPTLEREREQLAAALPALLDSLPADARLGASLSLTAVRDARTQILAALARNRGDAVLLEWLMDNQRQEVRVMRSIADTGEQGRKL